MPIDPVTGEEYSGSAPGFDLYDLLDNPVTSGIGTALDTLARPVRTALHTGDFEQSIESILDPDKASSTSDLLKDIGYQETAPGENRSWGTAFADFGANAAVGIFTDPATLLGLGFLTKTGSTVKSLGMEAAASLAEAGPRNAAFIAKQYNTKMLASLGEDLFQRYKLPELAEGAKYTDQLAHAQQVADQLNAFGLGRTFRERLARGEQSFLGVGNPFGSQMSGLVGGAEGSLNEITDLIGARKMANWLGDTASTVAGVAEKTALGKSAVSIAASFRDFVFNPVSKDALEQVVNLGSAINAREAANLYRGVEQFHETLTKAGIDLEGRKAVTELAQLRGVQGEAAHARIQELNKTLIQPMSVEQKRIVGSAILEFNDINDKFLAFANQKVEAQIAELTPRLLDAKLELAAGKAAGVMDPRDLDEVEALTGELSRLKGQKVSRLGDSLRELQDDLKGQLTEQERLIWDRNEKAALLNEAKARYAEAKDGVIDSVPNKNFEVMADYAAKQKDFGAYKERLAAEKQVNENLKVMTTETGEPVSKAFKAAARKSMDSIARTWAKQNNAPVLSWYKEVGQHLSPDELNAIAWMSVPKEARPVQAVAEAVAPAAKEASAPARSLPRMDPKNVSLEDLRNANTEVLEGYRATLSAPERVALDRLMGKAEAAAPELADTGRMGQLEFLKESTDIDLIKQVPEEHLPALYKIMELVGTGKKNALERTRVAVAKKPEYKAALDALAAVRKGAVQADKAPLERMALGDARGKGLAAQAVASDKAILEKYAAYVNEKGIDVRGRRSLVPLEGGVTPAASAGDEAVGKGLMDYIPQSREEDPLEALIAKEELESGRLTEAAPPVAAQERAAAGPPTSPPGESATGAHNLDWTTEGRILKHGLSSEDRSIVEAWLADKGYALPEGMWLSDAVKSGDEVAANMSAEAEVVLFEQFSNFMNKRTLMQPMGAGEDAAIELRGVFEKMAEQYQNVLVHGGKESRVEVPEALLKRPKTPEQPRITLNPYSLAKKSGQELPWQQSLQEFTDKVLSHGGGPAPVEKIVNEYRRSVMQALNKGYTVKDSVLQDAFGTTDMLSQVTMLNEKNLMRMVPEQSLDLKAHLQHLRMEVKAAQKAYDKAPQGMNAEALAAARQVVADLEKTVKQIPNHAQLYMTTESAQLVVQENLLRSGHINNAALMNKFTASGGRPLTPKEVNDLVKPHTERVARLIATGGKLAEKEMSSAEAVSTFLRVMNPDEATLEGIAKGSGKSIEEVRAMKPQERLQHMGKVYAELFDERPDVLLAANLETMTKRVNNHEIINGVRNLFSKPMKEVSGTLEEKQLAAQAMEQVSKIMSDPAGQKLGFDKIKELYPTAFKGVDEGYVPGEWLHKDLTGQQIKQEVFKRANAYLKPFDITKSHDAWKHLAKLTQLWKKVQLSWPGSLVRDWLGNAMLRMQHGGWHADNFTEMGNLMSVLRSEGNPDELAKLSIKVGDRTMTGLELHEQALKYGIFGHDDVTQELRTVLKDRFEPSFAGETVDKVVSKVNVVDKLTKWRGLMNKWERLNMFHARLAYGDTAAMAASATDQALYNYAHVSPFVDSVRKTGVFPFATWASKNIPAQMELLFTAPGQFAALMHAKYAMENGVPGVENEDLPKHLRSQWNIVHDQDEKGNVWFTTLTGIVPMADIPSVTSWEGIGQFFQQQLGPIPKTIIEQVNNAHMYNGKAIEKFDGEFDLLTPEGPQVSVRTKHLLKTMIGRPLSFADQATELATETVDPRLNRPKKFFEQGQLVSSLIGVSPKVLSADTRKANAEADGRDLANKVREAERAADRWRKRGRPDLAEQYVKMAENMQKERQRLLARSYAQQLTWQ